jgi:hypothetical protein
MVSNLENFFDRLPPPCDIELVELMRLGDSMEVEVASMDEDNDDMDLDFSNIGASVPASGADPSFGMWADITNAWRHRFR